MEASEFATIRDLAFSVNIAERHASRQLRLAYLASKALKRQIFGRDTMLVNVVSVTDTETWPWVDRVEIVFAQHGSPIPAVRTNTLVERVPRCARTGGVGATRSIANLSRGLEIVNLLSRNFPHLTVLRPPHEFATHYAIGRSFEKDGQRKTLRY